MKSLLNIVLWICVVLLVYVCYASIMKPIRFDALRQQREAAVKARLLDIRKAQSAYHLLHDGRYAASFDTLIQFVKTARLPFVQEKAGVPGESFCCDTCWVALADTLYPKGFQADSLRYIPYGKGAQFEIQVRNHEDSSGKVYDLLEVKAPLDAYLEGMDSQEVANWRAEQERQEKYAGLKIGDLETPNNNAGNWE